MLSKAYVEITNVCNLMCSFCPKTSRKPRFMTVSEFASAADKLSGKVKYIYLHLMGEPLLHPELKEILEEASKRGMKVIITTNGTLLGTDNAEAILKSKAIYKVSVSLHSYEANEARQSLDEYIDCVTRFMKRAADEGVISVMRLWNLDGDGTVGENALNGRIIDSLRRLFPCEWVKTRSGERIADKTYIEWGEKFEWPDPECEEYGSEGYCYGVHDQIGILCDGTVVPCCLDHNGDIPLGNIHEEELDTILSGERAKAMVRGFKDRRMTEELCRKCGFARRF